MAPCTLHWCTPVGWAIVGVILTSQLQLAALTTQHPSGLHHRTADEVKQQLEALKEQLHDLTDHMLDRFEPEHTMLSATPVELERCDCRRQCDMPTMDTMPMGRMVAYAAALEKERDSEPEIRGLDGERMDLGAALGGAVEAGTDFVTTGGIGTAVKAVAGVATSAADIVKAGETGMNAAKGIQGAWNSMSDVSKDRGCRGITTENECTGACLMDDVGQCRARTEVLDEKRANQHKDSVQPMPPVIKPNVPITPGDGKMTVPPPSPPSTGGGGNSNTCNCNCGGGGQPQQPQQPQDNPTVNFVHFYVPAPAPITVMTHYTVPYYPTVLPPVYSVAPPVYGGYLPPIYRAD